MRSLCWLLILIVLFPASVSWTQQPDDYQVQETRSKIELYTKNPATIKAVYGEKKSTELTQAIDSHNFELIDWLIEHGADVNHAKSDGKTALQLAYENYYTQFAKPQPEKWKKVCEKLIKAGAESNLPVAIMMGDIEQVKQFHPMEKLDEASRNNPLRLAASTGQAEICQYLIEKYGYDVNQFETGCGYPVMIDALMYPEVVKVLINHKADLKTRITWTCARSGIWIIQDEATLLHYAAEDGHPDSVRLLLDHGVDPLVTTVDLDRKPTIQTALDVAAYYGKGECARQILVHSQFRKVEQAIRQEIIDRCLVKCCFDSWLADDADRVGLLKILLEHGANPNSVHRKWSACQRTARDLGPEPDHHWFQEKDINEVRREVISLLKHHGAELDLFTAVAIGDDEIVKTILEKSPQLADITTPDRYSALHIAAKMGQTKIAEQLLLAGANPNPIYIKDEDLPGDTPLDVAESWDHEETAELIKRLGGKSGEQVVPVKRRPRARRR